MAEPDARPDVVPLQNNFTMSAGIRSSPGADVLGAFDNRAPTNRGNQSVLKCKHVEKIVR